jgi:predicted ATP-dependent endonuclease of OLD family
VKLASAHIRGFRAASDVSIDFDDLTALVGSGGAGKSTLLNALDWFFNGGGLAERDLHYALDGDQPVKEIIVAATFSNLTPGDRQVLGQYVVGNTTTLTRSWNLEEGEKLSGNALVLPEFEEIRKIEKALELRKAYRELHEAKGREFGLPDPPTVKAEVLAAMESWERQNPTKCQPQTSDARHLGGFTGTPLLASRFNYVLVGATTGAPEALEEGRGTILDRLLSVVEELGSDTKESIRDLQQKAQDQIKQLVANARGRDLLQLSDALTKRVQTYFPDAGVKLADEIADPSTPRISVCALVSDRGGRAIEPDLQGHGLQRALVIGLLHEIAEAVPSASEKQNNDPRALMLAIEEPELHQHPLQARALAGVLAELASANTGRPIQVAYSTHSPYFTHPALFGDLRLCHRDAAGGTACVAADAEAIRTAIEVAGFSGDVANSVEAALATNLREAIFAQGVLLCEGPTDAAVLEGIANLQGGLDRDGVAIAGCGNKRNLCIAIAILQQLGIPFFALFDGDAVGQNSGEAAMNKRLLALCEEGPEEWPKRCVRERSANFEDTLEIDLDKIWPQFRETCSNVAGELGQLADKNPRVYREAATRANDPPDFLVKILDAARSVAK